MRTSSLRPRRTVRPFHAAPIARRAPETPSNGDPLVPSGSNRPDGDGRTVSEPPVDNKTLDVLTPAVTRLGDIAERAAALSKELAEQNAPAGNGTIERVAELRERLRQVRQEALNCAGQVDRLNRRLGRPSRRSRVPLVEPQIIELPQWFMERNVVLCEHLQNKTLSDFAFSDREDVEFWDRLFPGSPRLGTGDVRGMPMRYIEVLSYLAGSFAIAKARRRQLAANSKNHLALYCHLDGSLDNLNSLVQVFAAQLDADFICLDAQDLAELASEFVVSDNGFHQNTIHSLGYDTYDENQEIENAEEESEHDEAEGPETDDRTPRGKGFIVLKDLSIPKEISRGITNLFQTQGLLSPGANNPLNAPAMAPINGMGIAFAQSPNHEVSLGALLEAIINSAAVKRKTVGTATSAEFYSPQIEMGKLAQAHTKRVLQSSLDQLLGIAQRKEHENEAETGMVNISESGQIEKTPRRTIIFIPDFMDLSATPAGLRVTSFLEDIVQQRRNNGEQIAIVGATDALDLEEESPMEAQRRLNHESETSRYRAILLPLDEDGISQPNNEEMKGGHDGLPIANSNDLEDVSRKLDPEERRRVQINYRHIGHMLSQLSAGHTEFDRFLPSSESQKYLGDRILKQDEVQYITSTAIGLHSLQSKTDIALSGSLDDRYITAALQLLDRLYKPLTDPDSDVKEADKPSKPSDSKQSKSDSHREMESRLASIRESANRYEKKLLSGVVLPKNIRTTFDDVHVAKETIEALKTLTSLSLQRPDAFKYGVLKSDTIPGLLLYGPPGTGKTMLAKAVAKESGATVLNISGSDVNQMYVGESEKTVRAIFSLARKLSPCVVFIDEADSLFAARSQSRQRAGHRDTINQFLQEWDGLAITTALLLVATNRPFDLDDAVLRRLPRRLLIDLPGSAARAAILALHLRGEALAPTVSLPALAAATPRYSGSDLKNVAVAAALAAVREERDRAAADPAFVPPPRRTLAPKHFEVALREIAASVSDDMESLAAIRRFDEEFGAGGRRRRAAWGFGRRVVGAEGDGRVRP